MKLNYASIWQIVALCSPELHKGQGNFYPCSSYQVCRAWAFNHLNFCYVVCISCLVVPYRGIYIYTLQRCLIVQSQSNDESQLRASIHLASFENQSSCVTQPSDTNSFRVCSTRHIICSDLTTLSTEFWDFPQSAGYALWRYRRTEQILWMLEGWNPDRFYPKFLSMV